MRMITTAGPTIRIGLLALAALGAVGSAGAQQPRAQVEAESSARRGLSLEHLQAVRAVSRNVLAAKARVADDQSDREELARLRASLDRIIAVDVDPQHIQAISVVGQESADQRASQQAAAELRQAARADARALAAQLRSRGEWMTARAQSSPDSDTTSGGFPIGRQRAQLFDRWARNLDAALADDNPERLGQLLALRRQLQTSRGSLSKAPLAHGTPTLQAMPAGEVQSTPVAGE